MDQLFKMGVLIVGFIVLVWQFGSITFHSIIRPETPAKPTSGFERLESSCIMYVQAMPVCGDLESKRLPSYLSSSCKSYITKNVIKAPGC